MIVWSSRSEFLGSHVTPQVKDALRQKAASEGISLSRLTYKILKQALGVKDDEEDKK